MVRAVVDSWVWFGATGWTFWSDMLADLVYLFVILNKLILTCSAGSLMPLVCLSKSLHVLWLMPTCCCCVGQGSESAGCIYMVRDQDT
jgi:hypothetical protein